jgi:hypothetical protein
MDGAAARLIPSWCGIGPRGNATRAKNRKVSRIDPRGYGAGRVHGVTVALETAVYRIQSTGTIQSIFLWRPDEVG